MSSAMNDLTLLDIVGAFTFLGVVVASAIFCAILVAGPWIK